MTTGSDKCSISSIIPMSCRDKAEAFARHLHSRLSSLGAQDGRPADENSWLGARENSVAVSQPRHSDPDLYFDFALVDSPGSPAEEAPQLDLAHLITNKKDNLGLAHGDDCHCSNQVLSLSSNGQAASSPESDASDAQYFELDAEADRGVLSEKDSLSTNSISCTSEDSTLSLQDYPSLDYSSCLQELNTQTDSFKDADQHQHDSNDTTENTISLSTSKINGDLCDVDCDIRLRDEGTNGDISTEEPLLNGEIDQAESYRSTLRIENNLTVDINDTSCDLINEIELDIEEEDREEVIPRVRRCSSLKTGKTPPGTPGRKKIVRFADVLGLDLADVRTYLDEIPKIPNSAYADLNAESRSSFSDSSYGFEYKFPSPKGDKLLVPLFQQPGGETDFFDKVRENQVCLENAIVEDPVVLSIKGTVRVRNLDFNKSVHIRYTMDSWRSFSDLQASYLENSCDGFSDKFSFLMYVNTISIGQRVEFAVRFQCKGAQYWDNNDGANYCFQCLPVTNTTPYAPITGVDDSWGAAFYYTAEPASREFSWHRQAVVHEYITATLDRQRRKRAAVVVDKKSSNPDIFSVMVIILFSIVFLYIQRAIYFT